jgi:hypothetical protein
MNATDIDTQMLLLQKQLEALKARKEAIATPAPAPAPPQPIETDEDKAKRLAKERMEAEIAYYLHAKMKELENEAYNEFDFNTGGGEATITVKRRSVWDYKEVESQLKDLLDEAVRQWGAYNDHDIDYDYDIRETDYTEPDEDEEGNKFPLETTEWEITLTWTYDALNHGLDYITHKKEDKGMLEDPEAFDWANTKFE